MTILSRLTRTQRVAVFLFLALLMNSLVRAATGYYVGRIGTAVLVVAFLVLLPFAVLPPIVRRVTWRVRNRLFLTYFLVGVLPIILIFLFVQLALDLVLSQTANFLLHEQLDQRIDGVYAQAERRAQAASAGREAVPVNSGETVILRAGVRSSTIPDPGLIVEFPAWSQPGFRGVIRSTRGKLFFAAHASSGEGERRADVFAVRELDTVLLSELLPGMAAIQVLEGQTVRFRIGGVEDTSSIKVVLDSRGIMPPPAAQGLWDPKIESGSPLQLRSLETGKDTEVAVVAITRPSAIMKQIFSTLGNVAFVLELFMVVVGAAFLLVEIAAVVASVKLARTLTGTVHDLYTGTKKLKEVIFPIG